MSTPKSPRNNQNQDSILEAFGGPVDWSEIADEYGEMEDDEILNALNQMWPQDDNAALAEMIFNELN